MLMTKHLLFLSTCQCIGVYVSASGEDYQDTWWSYWNCRENRVCFDPQYNKNDPPFWNVTVTLNPPKRLSLRKIDVFASTITLDISKIAIIWKDIRLALNTTHSQRSIGIEQSFRDQIWRPEIIFQEMKSVRTKFLHTPDTGIFVWFKTETALPSWWQW